MKKMLFFMAALMLAAIAPLQAQTFNGLELGGSIACSHQFRDRGFVNVGADLCASLPVATWSRLRAVVGVNGFVPNGFDRYGTVKVGATVDVHPLYLFADYGLSVNPSARQRIGMAFDAGLGLQVALASRWRLFTELSIDRINSGKLWQSTPAVKAGVMYSVTP